MAGLIWRKNPVFHFVSAILLGGLLVLLSASSAFAQSTQPCIEGSTCQEDNECAEDYGSDYECVDSECCLMEEEGECLVNDDCPGDLKCSNNNECVECTASADCSGCQTCSNNSCVDSDSLCGDDQVCDGGLCLGCTEDSDCPSDQSCWSNACVDCVSDTDCDGCETCTDGSCVDDDDKCTGDNLCVSATCVECTSDSHCDGCETCSGGACVDDDDKCGADELCTNSQCVECLENSDCPGSAVCSNNECVECTSDSHCYGCQTCGGNNQCVDNDDECDGCRSCNNGACADDSAKCSGDQVCVVAECRDPFDPVTELEENFSPTWQECLWRPYERIGGTLEYQDWDGTDHNNSIRVANDKLELAIPAESGGGLSWDFGLESKFVLGGDFQAEVEYEMAGDAYYTNLDMRGVNMLFVELMAGEDGTRRRHVRNTGFVQDQDESSERPGAHLWLSNPDNHDTVTQIDTDRAARLREIEVGQRPNRTAVDLNGNVYIHNRGRGYSGEWNPGSNTETTITFVKASELDDTGCEEDGTNCDLTGANEHVYTLDITGGQFGGSWHNGKWGGGVAVDRDNNLWYSNRKDGILLHIRYIPSDVPGGDEWELIESYDLTDELGRSIHTYGMAMARNGNIWIATRGSTPEAFVEINPDSGQIIDHQLPSSVCSNVYGIAIDAEQRLYRNYFGGTDSCTPFRYDPNEPDPDQAWLNLGGVSGSIDNGNRGLAVDSRGRVWSASDPTDRVVAYDTDTGDHVETLNNVCRQPIGVALDRNNRLWVSCNSDGFDNQVQYFDMDGNYLGSVGSVSTYTYSDMTGYALRNFGLDDWEESFTVDQTVSSNEYYVSTVENNYGGGIEAGAGGASAIDPAEAPFTITSGETVVDARRMRVSTYYHMEGIYRILEHPLYLEGIWGLRTHVNADLGAHEPSITMEEAGYVYVAFDERAPATPGWLSAAQGWAELSTFIYTTDPDFNKRLYRQHFEAGEVVEFGGTDGWDNYFVYVYPDALDAHEPDSPDAIIDEPEGDLVSTHGTLRIERAGSTWTYSYRDGDSNTWRVMERSGGALSDVPIRLRVRLDPFWHSGTPGDLGGDLVVRYDNFVVNYADNVPGSPYCREGCDETFAGYGSSCLGGPLGLCPGVMACNEETDTLECIPEPGSERCNGLDDDCDGFVDFSDEFPTQPVSHDGHQYLVDNFGMPGFDANDNAVTEGSDCVSDLLGPCAQGYFECVGGVMRCQSFVKPQPEMCDGEDNSCDGTPNRDLSDPIVQVGQYVGAAQRSAPTTPVRPLGGTDKPAFAQWVNFDGFNVDPPEPNPLEEGKARVSIYVQTGANGDPEYVLYLSHGAQSSTQGPVTASYHFRYYDHASAKGLLLQDGVVDERTTDNSQGANQMAQQVFVETGPTQTGGVAMGPFDPNANWSVDINAEFAGHVDTWELYNAATGSTMDLTVNEILTLSNMDLDGLYQELTSEVGTYCEDPVDFMGAPTAPGICSRGMLRCEEADGEWRTRCWSDVTAQMEVCDGRDNSCTGDIDGPLDKLTFPVVMLSDGPGGGSWREVYTVDTEQSAVEFMNFQPRHPSQARVGSPRILDVTDTSGASTIQDVDRSVMTVHRNINQFAGTLALAMAHGKYVEGNDGDIPGTASVDMRIRYDGSIEEEESFPVWYSDVADQEDGAAYTEADYLEFNRGSQQYFGAWDLHRWVANDVARREADGGVVSNIFAEVEDDTELRVHMRTNQVGSWEYYSPYLEENANFVDLGGSGQVAMRIEPRTFGDAACVIQENEIESCLGERDIYTCQDGQITCGLGGAGCCEPSHPMYGEECDSPVNPPAGLEEDEYNVGACRAEMRCDADGAWQCVQVQAPEPEQCDGQDNTCDGIVDGMVSGFEWYDDDGVLLETQHCPDSAETCGPAACGFEQICACRDDGCRCVAPLSDMLDGASDRICEYDEKLHNDMCVAVCSSSLDCPDGLECRYGECE